MKVDPSKAIGFPIRKPLTKFERASNNYFSNPLVIGHIVREDDVDGLISLYDELDQMERRIKATKNDIRALMKRKAEGTAKTRRVLGLTRCMRVEMPDDHWDQAQLRKVWDNFPKHRGLCLKIASLRVGIRDFKKLANSTGDLEFNRFRDEVAAANEGPAALPRCVVER